ncbi:protein polybromo-1 isoform X3 [Copidosoma floridanum]|uniref:protein polybromo-1 isoform X3 n=1 Tax=Copidosoma floridanum TaxID=29053 RepID=UPI0006C9B285|nr:protein polybromo-1 isoform X3 [Copidosoma floridanum]
MMFASTDTEMVCDDGGGNTTTITSTVSSNNNNNVVYCISNNNNVTIPGTSNSRAAVGVFNQQQLYRNRSNVVVVGNRTGGILTTTAIPNVIAASTFTNAVAAGARNNNMVSTMTTVTGNVVTTTGSQLNQNVVLVKKEPLKACSIRITRDRDIDQRIRKKCKKSEDAMILQRLVMQTKMQLSENEESVPDVPAAVQEILATIFTAVYNHQDEEGRCYSDSMSELPEHDIVDGKKIRGLSLDLIKRRLDKEVYKRLDSFQEDVFNCLERARKLSRTDSQVFEDSVELQAFFLRTRDEVTKNGDLLHSPALNYSLVDLGNQVAELKREKSQQEALLSNEDESCDGNEKMVDGSASSGENGSSMSFNQETYRAGDFVYVEPSERGMETNVVLIERLWTNSEGQQMLYGNLFYRPSETYHVASRKFLDKELFKSDAHVAVTLSKVVGRCCVLSVKDYFRMVPEGFPEKDVYVCESRYSTRARAFKKIKVWNFDPDHLKLTPREKLLEPKRIISVYKERLEKHKEEIAELEESEKPAEKEKPNVILFTADNENTHYEQYNSCVGPVKLGDFVIVATSGGKQQLAQIDSIWSTKDGKCYFKGPWMLTPAEITHAPTKLFYKQEMFLSTVEATHPIVAIVGKCAVLDYSEYICSRPTEIPEDDVYICESLYDENKNVIKKLGADGLKKFNHSSEVTEDEIYFFRKPINPAKVPSDTQIQNSVKSIVSSTNQYETWRKLAPAEKSVWEERANKLNEENEGLRGAISMRDLVYECCWDTCDWQFEDMADCIEHSVVEPTGHVQTYFANASSDVEYKCQWRGCGRMKKSQPPFPSVQRLARHVKEVHILKSTGRAIPPSDRSKNYVPAKGSTTLAPMETETSAAATQTNNVGAVKQAEPLFIAVPPRPSRVLHSDAYLRYIEGLNTENRYISNWDRQLIATPENTQVPDVTKLPAEWLGNGVGNHGNVVNALWTLRNMMMRDVLAINKTL